MFEIGFWELVMVGVVALLVVGPERLPGLARTAGHWLGKARRMLADVKAEVDRELQLDELKQSLRQQTDLDAMKDLGDRVKSLRQELQTEYQEVQTEYDDPGPPPGWRPGMPASSLPNMTMPQMPPTLNPPSGGGEPAVSPAVTAAPVMPAHLKAQTPAPLTPATTPSVLTPPATPPTQSPPPPAAS